MKWSVGTKIGAGFAITLAIFIVVGVVSYRTTVDLVEASAWRQHTYDVLMRIEQMRIHQKDIQLGARGYVLIGDDEYLEPYQTAVASLDTALPELRRLTSDSPRQTDNVVKLERLFRNRIAIAQEVVDARRTSGFEAGLQLVKSGKGTQGSAEILQVLASMDEIETELLAARAAAADQEANNAKATLVIGVLLAIALAGAAGFTLSRNIAGPLQALTASAERITAGDLSANVTANDRQDEVGVLARAFERMARSLRAMAAVAEQIAAGDLRTTLQPQSSADVLGTAFARMTSNLRQQIGGMAEGATVLGSATSEIVASTTQLASSASQSAAAVSQTTTTVEEIRQTAHVATQKAKAVLDTAQKAAQISQTGRKSAEDATNGMSRIRAQMEAIAESMMRLSEQSHTIGLIIATVEDLAAQSNLLAVNAAIEAAKAGEHGKGFGVVAQEVKSLAEQSRQATDRVRTILGDIQKATTAAVMATEQGSKAVEGGSRQTELAGESIAALTGTVSEAAQTATQIAASSQQQLIGMDQVAGAMENIKQASTQNVASAKQLEAAARNLNDLGQRLKQLVQGYAV
jgi:methyl-accepting chemotaxis protein